MHLTSCMWTRDLFFFGIHIAFSSDSHYMMAVVLDGFDEKAGIERNYPRTGSASLHRHYSCPPEDAA